MRNLPHDYFFRQSVYVSAYGQRYAPGKQEAVADYDVTFHPEGGYFIEGVRSTAGFKALRADGVSADITGQIVDETGREVVRFASRHAGMGKCTFTPEAGHRYTAICRDAAGTERRVRLPEAEHHTCVLQVYPASERFTVQAAAASAYDPGALRLLIHCRGNVCYNGVLDPVTRQASFRWEDFPQGVLQILLLDEMSRSRLPTAGSSIPTLPTAISARSCCSNRSCGDMSRTRTTTSESGPRSAWRRPMR